MSTTTMSPAISTRFRLGAEYTETESATGDGPAGSGIAIKSDLARFYHADDLQSGQPVAVKVLIQGSSKTADFRARFERDAEILQAFEHPNIVQIIAHGLTDEGQPYLAMEELQGQTLTARLAKAGPVGPDEVAPSLRQIAEALDAAHSRGIIHRNINPDALLIADGSDAQPVVKLFDFAMAGDSSGAGASQAELTSKQTSLGTAAYLSPEQARGAEVDGRSDVYALGVTLFQTLTGQIPFSGESDFQILLAKINGSIPPFPQGWSDRPDAPAIEAVVLQALAQNPADRPATAGALADLFEAASRSRPRRKSGAFALVLAIGVVVLALGLLAKWLL